jgi:hypothetical protein
VYFGRSPPIFWKNVSPPSSEPKSKPSNLLLAGVLLGLLFDLEEAICSSKTSVDLYLTIWSYTPENCNLQKYYLGASKPLNSDLGFISAKKSHSSHSI